MWKIGAGVFLGWNLGANDTANVFGTGVATGVVRYQTAIWFTAGFVLIGAVAEGPKCMDVMGELSRLVPADAFFCATAAGITMMALTLLAIPASASQAVVGAVIGVGIASGTADFSKLYKILVCWFATPLAGMFCGYTGYYLLKFILDRTAASVTRRNRIYFGGIMLAGCYGAYSLGANNVANVTGVYVGAGILSVGSATIIGGVSIALGALTYGKRIMMTVGKGIAPLDPFSALVTVLAEALSLHVFTQIGVPVSSSQAIVGAVVGVGLTSGIRTVNPKMLARIGMGWLATPVVAGYVAWCLTGFRHLV